MLRSSLDNLLAFRRSARWQFHKCRGEAGRLQWALSPTTAAYRVLPES
jgi:hypothetical protein